MTAGALPECFERLDALRARDDVPADAFALPGPLIRQVVHFLDGIGRGPAGRRALGGAVGDGGATAPTTSPTAEACRSPTRRPGARAAPRSRPLPVHRQPSRRPQAHRSADRGDGACRAPVPLRIAGTGPQEASAARAGRAATRASVLTASSTMRSWPTPTPARSPCCSPPTRRTTATSRWRRC